MANRVNINVRARDLTRGELNNMRRQFGRLGNDMNRLVGRRTQLNFDAMNNSLMRSARALNELRGRIPDEEFRRLNAQLVQTDRLLRRGLTGVNNRAALNALRNSVRDLDDEFQRLSARTPTRIVPDVTVRRGLGRRAARGIWGALSSPFRVTARALGGLLSDGIGQALISGLRAMGPIVGPIIGTALLAAALAAMSMLGAAIGAALVLAIGGAFTALGVASAIQTDEIQRNWKVAAEKIKGHFATVGDGLVPVIHDAIHTLEGLADRVAPHIRDALTAAAPHIDTFLGHIVSGFEKLGERSASDLEKGFNNILAALGPMLEDTLAGMGDALGALGRTMQDHSTEIAMALNAIIGLITTAIDIINFFANTWVTAIHTSGTAIGFLIQMVGWMLDGILDAFDKILGGAETAFGWIPGVGSKLAGARAAFNTYRESVAGDFDRLSSKFKDVGKDLDHANRQRKLTVDIASYQARLAQARRDLKKTSNQKAQAKLRADISDLNAKIRAAARQLNAMDGRTATTYIYTNYLSTETARRRGSATGGITGAATGGARSNMTMVGEHGPELVDLPGGSRVTSNEKSRQLLAKGGSGPAPGMMMLNLSLGGVGLGSVLVDLVRGEVLSQGGDVQATLGERSRGR